MIYFEMDDSDLNIIRSNINIESDEFNSLLNYLLVADEFGNELFYKFKQNLSLNGIAVFKQTAEYVEDYCKLMNWEWRQKNG